MPVAAHAHVEASAAPEREAALGVVDLVRRDAKVEQNSVEPCAVERVNGVERSVVRLDRREASCVGKGRETRRSGGERLRIAIYADDRADARVEQRLAVAAAAEGAVEHAR